MTLGGHPGCDKSSAGWRVRGEPEEVGAPPQHGALAADTSVRYVSRYFSRYIRPNVSRYIREIHQAINQADTSGRYIKQIHQADTSVRYIRQTQSGTRQDRQARHVGRHVRPIRQAYVHRASQPDNIRADTSGRHILPTHQPIHQATHLQHIRQIHHADTSGRYHQGRYVGRYVRPIRQQIRQADTSGRYIRQIIRPTHHADTSGRNQAIRQAASASGPEYIRPIRQVRYVSRYVRADTSGRNSGPITSGRYVRR
uniref:Uncharacterized protein n=1 Tax=Knipowitschia caucasica TaxID=637954 RepID=A0AAV2L4F3_KNICA